MSGTSHGYPTATISRRGPAPHRWTPLPASTSGIGCPGPGTGGSTTSCIVINMAAIAQIRLDTEGRTYYRRKFGEARTRSEARRCLKRRLSDMVYSQLVADAATQDAANDTGAGPGGHPGASLSSSAADLYPPVIGSSDQPQPEPAAGTLLAPRRPTPPL